RSPPRYARSAATVARRRNCSASASARSTASSRNTRSRSDGVPGHGVGIDVRARGASYVHEGRSARHTTSRARAELPSRTGPRTYPFPLAAESVEDPIPVVGFPRPVSRDERELQVDPGVEDVNGALRFPLRQALATPFGSDRENRAGAQQTAATEELEVFRLEGRVGLLAEDGDEK